jgi:hypothetical protein
MGTRQVQGTKVILVSEKEILLELQNRIELLEISVRNILERGKRYKRSIRQKDKQIVRLEELIIA